MTSHSTRLALVARTAGAGLLAVSLFAGVTGAVRSASEIPESAAPEPAVVSNASNVETHSLGPRYPLALRAEWRIEAEDAAAAAAAIRKPAVELQANQFTFPALGIKAQHVYYFGCDSPAKLYNYLYQWGCARTNNVYLLGHAYGTFKPLRTAYLNGSLKVGMLAYYAGTDGVTRTYQITEIRHERISMWKKWGGWASGSLAKPGLTLQTCDGPSDAYRIVVRMVSL